MSEKDSQEQTSPQLTFPPRDERKFIHRPIPGTRITKEQIFISSGIPQLDAILGGGIQEGSLLLIEEDEFGVFSKYFLKYFLAEGLECRHSSFVASMDEDTHQLMSELPSAVDYSDTDSVVPSGSEDLKIAWRYQDSPRVPSAPSNTATTFGHNFDLTVPYPKEAVDNADVAYWPQTWPPSPGESEDAYLNLLYDVRERIHKQGHSVSAAPARRTLLRIALHRLGSPLWPRTEIELPMFLSSLRWLVRSAHAAVVVTLHSSLQEGELLSRCRHLSDNAIRLQSLANANNPLYTEFNGLLTIHKLSTLNSVSVPVPETMDWGFKLRKRKFVIEKLHLPPELQESAQREQDDVGLPCASARKPDLEF